MLNDYTLLELHRQRIDESAVLYEQYACRAALAAPHAFRRLAHVVGAGCVHLGERLLAYGRERRSVSLPITHVR